MHQTSAGLWKYKTPSFSVGFPDVSHVPSILAERIALSSRFLLAKLLANCLPIFVLVSLLVNWG